MAFWSDEPVTRGVAVLRTKMLQQVICFNLSHIVNIVQSRIVNDFLTGHQVFSVSPIFKKRDSKLL